MGGEERREGGKKEGKKEEGRDEEGRKERRTGREISTEFSRIF